MKRGYCSKCQGTALIVDNKFLCCDTPINGRGNQKKMMCQAQHPRRRPTPSLQREIMRLQDGKCLYCGNAFGELVYRKTTNKIIPLKVHWDHLVPFSYAQNNKRNFVAACHVCNGIKSNKMFNTVEEVFHYIKYHWEKKGYKLLMEAEV